MKKSLAFVLMGFVFLSFSLVSCTKNKKAKKNDWSNVLNGQGEEEFKNLQKLIKESDCQNVALPDEGQLESLMTKFQEGNEWVFKNLVSVYICLNNEQQASIDIQGGVLFDQKTEDFVKYVKDLEMAFLLFKFLMTVPEDMKEDFEKQKELLQARLEKVKAIEINAEEKKDTISALELKLELISEGA